MSSLKDIKKDNLHHAYFIKGRSEYVLDDLIHFFEKELSFKTKGNPDFWYGFFETFGIDEGRNIKRLQARRPVGERKIFIIAANSMTIEAQNALLKMFEEPTNDTHFFVILPREEILLPTLLSRLFYIRGNSDDGRERADAGFGEGFLSADAVARLVMLREIIENKDKMGAIAFLDNIEYALYKRGLGKTEPFVFKEIQKARLYMNDRSPSVKMLLEHIALIV